MCDASRNQEACCSCWAVPNTQNALQNFNQEVRILENSWTIQCIFGGLHFYCHAKRLTISFFSFFLSAESLRLIPFFKQYEMNQCMIHGKELRWHSVSPFTGHLFLAYLTEMPRLRYVLSAVRIWCELAGVCWSQLWRSFVACPRKCALCTLEFDGGILGCQDTLYCPCLYIRHIVIQIYLLFRWNKDMSSFSFIMALESHSWLAIIISSKLCSTLTWHELMSANTLDFLLFWIMQTWIADAKI